jgi:hypothetical protein
MIGGRAMQEAQQVVELLNHVRERPPIWLGGYNPQELILFIHGLGAGVAVFGLRIERHPGSAYYDVLIERGWEFLAGFPVDEMRERGLSEQEIVRELLTIEIETWKRAYQLAD